MPPREAGAANPLLRLLAVAVTLAGVVRLARSRRAAPPGVDAEDLAVGYERSDGSVTGIVAGGVALLAVLALVLVGVSSLEAWLTGMPIKVARPDDLIAGRQGGPTPAPPRLEAEPGAEAAAYRAREDKRLQSYHWVDRQAGTVAIPIDRAMDLLASSSPPSPTPDPARPGAPAAASSGRTAPGRGA